MCEERCDEANTQITACSDKKDLHSCYSVALAVIKDAELPGSRVTGTYGFGVAPITKPDVPESSCAAPITKPESAMSAFVRTQKTVTMVIQYHSFNISVANLLLL